MFLSLFAASINGICISASVTNRVEKKKKTFLDLRKNIFACLFSVHNTISLHVMNKYV